MENDYGSCLTRARKFAKEAELLSQIQRCHVDDWHNDGFNIFVTVPHTRNAPDRYWITVELRGLIQRLRRLIKKHDGHLEWFDGPRMQYCTIDGRKYRDGYDRPDYKLSVRFPIQ